ncbi:hypothetical protein CIB48_g5964 [Xylaria polymorpha]|nr:hypothetical protein CIB48_g5964 [Xylaria polymorpha]
MCATRSCCAIGVDISVASVGGGGGGVGGVGGERDSTKRATLTHSLPIYLPAYNYNTMAETNLGVFHSQGSTAATSSSHHGWGTASYSGERAPISAHRIGLSTADNTVPSPSRTSRLQRSSWAAYGQPKAAPLCVLKSHRISISFGYRYLRLPRLPEVSAPADPSLKIPNRPRSESDWVRAERSSKCWGLGLTVLQSLPTYLRPSRRALARFRPGYRPGILRQGGTSFTPGGVPEKGS